MTIRRKFGNPRDSGKMDQSASQSEDTLKNWVPDHGSRKIRTEKCINLCASHPKRISGSDSIRKRSWNARIPQHKTIPFPNEHAINMSIRPVFKFRSEPYLWQP